MNVKDMNIESSYTPPYESHFDIDPSFEEPLVTVLIQMKRNYEDFAKIQIEEFKQDLSILIAYPVADIHEEKHWNGCVFYQADLPEVAAFRMQEIYRRKDEPDLQKYDEVLEMHEFIKKHSITSIRSYFP